MNECNIWMLASSGRLLPLNSISGCWLVRHGPLPKRSSTNWAHSAPPSMNRARCGRPSSCCPALSSPGAGPDIWSAESSPLRSRRGLAWGYCPTRGSLCSASSAKGLTLPKRSAIHAFYLPRHFVW